MEKKASFIGFGEAGAAFSSDLNARGHDLKLELASARAAKLSDFVAAKVQSCASYSDALKGAEAILCLVTADQALAAAQDGAASIEQGAFWFDMNSVAPETKRRAASVIEAAGGRYVDVAVMAPAQPARKAVPLLVSGPHASPAVCLLRELGFTDVRALPGPVGTASAVKMIRSVMVKGIEALTAECFLAAGAVGLTEEVGASLDASRLERSWAERADYNLDRMIAHGVRRAAEMDEVANTLDELGSGSAMSRATASRQREIGAMGLTPVSGLAAKIAAISGVRPVRVGHRTKNVASRS